MRLGVGVAPGSALGIESESVAGGRPTGQCSVRTAVGVLVGEEVEEGVELDDVRSPDRFVTLGVDAVRG